VAQMLMTGADFNPFHMHGTNPWAYENRFDPVEHSYKGLIAMLKPENVDVACDAPNPPLRLDLAERFTFFTKAKHVFCVVQ